jgi:hypothetical protein
MFLFVNTMIRTSCFGKFLPTIDFIVQAIVESELGLFEVELDNMAEDFDQRLEQAGFAGGIFPTKTSMKLLLSNFRMKSLRFLYWAI